MITRITSLAKAVTGAEAVADITAGASVQEPLLSANGFSLSAEDGCRRGQFPRPAGSQEPAGQ